MIGDLLADGAGVGLYCGVLAWLFVTRPYAGVALLWLLIPLTWRIASSLYIDLAGPVLSDQLRQYLGPGHATSLLATNCAVIFLGFGLVLPRRLTNGYAPAVARPKALDTIVFAASAGFVAALYLDMLRIGAIPLLAGIERYDYARNLAGIFHQLLVRFGDVFALMLGSMFVLPTVFNRPPASRYLWLLFAILGYAFLTGNRYSAFFKFGTLFAVPCALLLAPSLSWRPQNIMRIPPAIRFASVVIATAAIVMVAYALFNSYFSVRFEDSDDPVSMLLQRVLVQQAELWWMTYHRLLELGVWVPDATAAFLFKDPINADANTSAQYLMYAAIGGEAIELLDQGQQYAGGFAEVVHELFGGPGGLVGAFLLALATGVVLRTLLVSLSEGRVFTALWSAVVLYPFAIMFWGGMLNFVLAWTFWAKVSCLAGSLLIGRWMSATTSARAYT